MIFITAPPNVNLWGFSDVQDYTRVMIYYDLEQGSRSDFH